MVIADGLREDILTGMTTYQNFPRSRRGASSLSW